MEECLPYFLIRVFVVPSRIVKRAKQFIPPTLFPTALHKLRQENSHRVVVGNRKPMRMLSHACTSILQIVFVLPPPISSISKSTPKFTSRPPRTPPVLGICTQSAVFFRAGSKEYAGN
jgi:hypothetical protein